MHYQYRFSDEVLSLGYNILVDAGLDEELSYCSLPNSWNDAQCVDINKMKIRTGPYILIDNEFLELNDKNNTFDYLNEIESYVCENGVNQKEFSSYMYDLIMYCIDMRVNADK